LNRSPDVSSNMFGLPNPQARSMFEGTDLLSDPQTAFWKSYQACEDSALQQLTTSPDFVCVLSKVMEELTCYHKLSKEAGWDEEGESTVTKMKALIRRLFGVLVEQYEKYNVAAWSRSAISPTSLQWSDLSPLDWTMIWRSILLLSYDKYFCQVFGKEKMLSESLAQSANAAWIDLKSFTCSECSRDTTAATSGGGKQCTTCRIVFVKELPIDNSPCVLCYNTSRRGRVGSCRCTSCLYTYQQLEDDWRKLVKPFYYNGKPVPVNPDPVYKSVVHVDVPESLSSPKHFGHLAWKFCELMASLDGMK
jgi:hypothetical protein